MPAVSVPDCHEFVARSLAYAEGYSHKEIAAVTGLRATGIRLLLFRARRKLARLLRQKNLKPARSV
jgi:DNA-directed RNA polymerase specialized sigma24 family protein